MNIISLLYRQRYVVVSRSSDNCTYCKSIWIKRLLNALNVNVKIWLSSTHGKIYTFEHIEIWKIPKTMETLKHSKCLLFVRIRMCLHSSSRRTTTLGVQFLCPSFILIMGWLALASRHVSQHPLAPQPTFLFHELPNKRG